MRFGKNVRLLKSREYQTISRLGRKKTGRFLVVDLAKGNLIDSPKGRLGITISRKFGKSHDRNRLRRLIREAFRSILTERPIPFDLVVRPKLKHTEITLSAIERQGVYPKMTDIRKDLYEIIFGAER